ncbi:g688 [Coccomyxa viridis]|uniref:G688 protein n=1 Tax=Coccomyxa viridis TaxID=1274662 RepID=A0ABP1FLK4_9CHLO
MDMPAKLGAIFYNSIAHNQSYAVSEALRWLLRPVSDLSVPVPAENITDFNRISSNMGAAVAYAMTYAYQNTTIYPAVIGPPQANGTVLQSGTDPLVSVSPNATDVFYVAASALMGVVGNGCDANWRCHVGDCDGPEDIVRKRVGVCCTSVSPMLSAISRQLHLFSNDKLIDEAMPAYIQAQNPTVLEFLSRCNRFDFGDTSELAQSVCNSNASSNYMGSTVLLDVNSNTPGAPPVASALDCCLACIGNAQCNVWVYCGDEHGCSGCNGQALNYRAGAGSSGQTFGPYGRGCYDAEGLGSLFPTGTCTLKSAVFRTSPQAYPDSGSFLAFTSGYLTPHSAS